MIVRLCEGYGKIGSLIMENKELSLVSRLIVSTLHFELLFFCPIQFVKFCDFDWCCWNFNVLDYQLASGIVLSEFFCMILKNV